MNLKSFIASITFVTCTMFAANGHAQAPAGSTGECKDGTYSSATSKRGACAAHGGVKDWYGTKKPAASSTPAAAAPIAAAATPPLPAKTKSAAPAASTVPPAKPAETPTAAAAPGGGPGQVWVNTSSKVYHCQGDKYYGKTKKGEYMTEAAAKAAGNHADHGKACS